MAPSSVANWAAFSKNPSKFDERDRLQAMAARAELPVRSRIEIKEKFKEATIVNGRRTTAVKKVEVLLPGLDGGPDESAEPANGSNRPAGSVGVSKAAKGAGGRGVDGGGRATAASSRPGHFVGNGALPATTKTPPPDDDDLISLA